MKKIYPVGSKWIFVGKKTWSEGIVWFERMEGKLQIWRYSFSYSDGSGYVFDWATSRAMAVDMCARKFNSAVDGKPIFRRVPDLTVKNPVEYVSGGKR